MLSTFRIRAVLAAGVFALCIAGCGAPPSPDPDGGGAVCDPGTRGCPCVDGRCGKSASGESLQCLADVCEALACIAGENGCACRGGNTCNAPGAACTNGYCLAANCTLGGANCGCIAGTCDVGLTCLDSTVCVDSRGYEGGACLPNGSCYRGSRCDGSTNRCVFCSPGSAGCQCTTGGGCNSGLVCAADACVPGSSLPPANPVCFTPCPQVPPAGMACSSDGLMNGCPDGQSCTQGSCLSPGQTKPTCASDVECPFFQVCLAGGCYSNCDVNADCPSGMGCYKRACRPTCSVAAYQATCPVNTACTSNDGQNGFCTPTGTGSPSPSPNPSGGLEIARSLLEFSNVRTSAEFVAVPRSAITQDVVVRKKRHRVTFADGTVEIVEAKVDGATGEYKACNPAAGECPLYWLSLGTTGVGGTAPAQTQSTSYRLSPRCYDDLTQAAPDAGAVACPRIRVENAGGVAATSWTGELEVSSGQGSTTSIQLSYVQRPDGQWVGSMYYFGTFGTRYVEDWVARADKKQTCESPNFKCAENGLIQRWALFRNGGLDGWKEFLAVLTATRDGSWKFNEVKNRCGCGTPPCPPSSAVCYPYTNSSGVRIYVQDYESAPVPSGVAELPIGFNLQIDPGSPALFTGRVESSLAMHYPGNPELKIEFASNPADPALATSIGGDSVVFLNGIQAVLPDRNRITSMIGGRTVSADGTCPTNFVPVDVPWLIPGFTSQTRTNAQGVPVRTECRESALPFTVNVPKGIENKDLAGANPVGDGLPRQRTMKFIDGALVNQNQLFLLFQETYDSFIPDAGSGAAVGPVTAYGYILLRRAPANLQPDAYVGRQTTSSPRTVATRGVTCSNETIRAVLGQSVNPSALSNAQYGSLVLGLIYGSGSNPSNFTAMPSTQLVHYLCEDTGAFNGGKNDYGVGGSAIDCPAGSKVTYFVTDATTYSKAAAAADPCQTTKQEDGRASCFARLEEWRTTSTQSTVLEFDPYFKCSNTLDGGLVTYCDDNRKDLTADKVFYRRAPAAVSAPMRDMYTLVDRAFRYKTRFRTTSGQTLGFAPQQCVPNSDSIPYCYDPAEIQEARDRIDCLIDIYSRPGRIDALGPTTVTTRTDLLKFLSQNFSSFTSISSADGGSVSVNREAFERLYAELLVMQGDESLTAAYSSRFDLAATGGASFKGSLFEQGGIDLTGVAGAELYKLYQAVQYYQLALDRLYLLGFNFSVALSRGSKNIGDPLIFVTEDTVSDYLERLVRAAAQKSRAWGEIARRYQNFNHPELARRVIERGYINTYLESAIISRLMQDIAAGSAPSFRDGIRVTLEKAQRSYRMSLLDMRDVYAQISDDLNFFGYPADYIPFPTLDTSTGASANAFESLLAVAKQRLDLAKTREMVALTSARQGRVDTAQFQSDLVSIRNNYENQLAQACGTFKGSDGNIYPAIAKYAAQSQLTLQMGNPCGLMGNGDIHLAAVAATDNALKLKGVLLRHQNILADIQIEQERVAKVCGVLAEQVDYNYERAGVQSGMQTAIAKSRAEMSLITSSIAATVSGLQALSNADAINYGAIGAAAAITVAGVTSAGLQYGNDIDIAEREAELRDYDATTMKLGNFQCNTADGGVGINGIESAARVATLRNDTLEVEVEALRADYALRSAAAEVERMYNNAQRIRSQYEEAEALSVDIQAAQNDPNVRIYQNDSVINADLSFNDALATAYRLTRVFEYYTSQSYAKKEQLFLIRMISAGQYNLENYLLELENAFMTFQDQFGVPDLRVMVLSLRDDILSVPFIGTDGKPLTEDARITLLREKLKDPRLLDSRGYLTLPFSTSIRDASPVTRNHKIHHVEVDLQGVRMGDSLARVYLRSAGTGVVRNVSDAIDYYVFPERLSVINASVGGAKVYDADVYRNFRFRDRPLANTLWELVVNRRDESVNKDIDLGTLSDIRVLVYYTDMTSF